MNWLSQSYGVVGRLFFGLALIGSGLLQLIRQDFVRHVPKLPPWISQPGMWACISGVLLLAAGVAITFDRKRRQAATVVAVLFFLVLLLYLPGLWANPSAGFMWTNPCKTLALLGTAILLAAMPQRWNPASGRVGEARVGKTLSLSGGRIPPLSAMFFGVFLVVCGVQHFVYVDFVVTLVPVWLPPGLHFWTYFTGVALVAGGIGINFPPTARLAAELSGLMIFLWVVLLHIPRTVAAWPEAFETAGIFEALALSGTAFLIAGVGSNRAPGAGEAQSSQGR